MQLRAMKKGGKLQPNGRRGKTDPQGWHMGQTGSLHRTTDMRGAVRGIIRQHGKIRLRNKVKRPGPVAPPAMGWGAPDSKHPVQPPSQWMVQRHPEDRGRCVCVCVCVCAKQAEWKGKLTAQNQAYTTATHAQWPVAALLLS